MKKLFILILLSINSLLIFSQEYQWSVKIDGNISSETKGNPEAYLWLPSDCQKVTAVVFSQQNMSEEPIFNNAKFRATMKKLGIGIIWVAPSISQEWNVEDGCQRLFEKMMSDLADVSGYSELKTVPIVPLGHSAMATFPWNFAAWNNDRTLAVISYHGDAPRTNLWGYGREDLEWGRERNIDGIPGLMIEGEWEWWEARVNPALSFRMKYPNSCVSFLCDTGHGHFDVSDEVIDYMCMFLQKAVSFRFTDKGLKRLNPQDGWLAARWNTCIRHRPAIAQYSKYKGDKHDAFWYFDREIANTTEQYYTRSLGKKTQYIGYIQGGALTGYDSKLHAGTIVGPMFAIDGVTFNIGAVYTDSTRMKTSSAHSDSGIKISVINGPVIQVNDTTFRFDMNRVGMNNKRRSTSIWLQAISNADKRYKGTAQQLNICCPYRINDGQRQAISFKSLQDIDRNVRSITLNAQSDSNLPVSFYVKYGPAHIDGNQLIIDQIPPRTKLPIEVCVVAWQYGIEGKYQTADNVERIFYIR